MANIRFHPPFSLLPNISHHKCSSLSNHFRCCCCWRNDLILTQHNFVTASKRKMPDILMTVLIAVTACVEYTLKNKAIESSAEVTSIQSMRNCVGWLFYSSNIATRFHHNAYFDMWRLEVNLRVP